MMALDGLPAWFYTASTWVVPVLLAITLHEAAHGFVAWRLGDDTAWRLGRVSANPLRHIDPFGTILLPGMLLVMGAPFLFGWAKPVPVAFHRLRNPRRDMVWVSLAGPAANVALALAAALLMHLLGWVPYSATLWAQASITHALQLNVMLAVFNLLPIPPLDGWRVALGVLPKPLAWRLSRLERFGMVLLLVLLFLPPFIGSRFGQHWDPLAWLLLPAAAMLQDAVATVAGLRG